MDVRQRNSMGMGKAPEAGNFGVKSFADTESNGKSMGGSDGTILPDSQRCSPVGMGGGKMMAQSNPSHGKHK